MDRSVAITTVSRDTTGRHLRRELRPLAADIVYPHSDIGIVEELMVLQEAKGKPILADHQL
jgi:hypothetical protein